MGKIHDGDGKFVVVEGDQRVSGLHDTAADAAKEVEKHKKLAETKGEKTTPPQVKQNLFG